MTTLVHVLAAMTAFGLVVVPCEGEERPFPPEADRKKHINVVDVAVISSNQVTFGTNTMSLAAATNLLATCRGAVDVIAVHGSGPGEPPAQIQSSTVARLASVGVPLVFVEQDGEYAWREQSTENGIRTAKVGTDQFAALRRLWMRGKGYPETPPQSTLQTSVQWDTATGNYEFSRVELGLLGKRVWLMHEQRESDEESGRIGIQIKKEW